MAADDVLIERLLRVIDEGRRTATYKLALVLAIVDAAAMSPGESELPTRLIAERVLELYYPQTRPYVDTTGVSHQARQIVMKTSTVLAAIGRLRSVAELRRCRNIEDVRVAAPTHYLQTLDVVEETFVRYPIPLMQVVGATVVPFLYEVDWPEGTSVKSLRKRAEDRVRLRDGVANRLVVLGPMLRPLIEMHWTRRGKMDAVANGGRVTADPPLRQRSSRLPRGARDRPQRASNPEVLLLRRSTWGET